MRLKISARKSDLARLQAYRVAEALKKKHPQIEIEFLFKESLGDKNLTDPLWKIPEKGVFTEDFYNELVTGATDMVVHSWKDLPTELKPDTLITATLPRADQRDLLLVKKADFSKIRELKKIRIFSSSPRRAYNLAPFLRETLPFSLDGVDFESVRGNIPTRLRKLVESTEVSGLILAKAALDRLLAAPEEEFLPAQELIRNALAQVDWMVLPLSVNPNAAAQGALAIEIFSQREDLKKLLQSINDPICFDSVLKERGVLAQYGGGCHQKIGVAVLPRSYGAIQICRGLTDSGVKLNQNEVLKESKHKFAESEMWSGSSESFFTREEIKFQGIPSGTQALFVAKSSAWPKGLSYSGILWTAGINTWKKLAKLGLWVHGTQDGLGENEVQHLEILAGKKLNWVKLTHEGGVQSEGKKTLATYRLLPKSKAEVASAEIFQGKKSFFWTSSSQFLRALELEPSLADKNHACGPGNSFQIIQDKLQQLRPDKANQVEVFLSTEEWKQKCKN